MDGSEAGDVAVVETPLAVEHSTPAEYSDRGSAQAFLAQKDASGAPIFEWHYIAAHVTEALRDVGSVSHLRPTDRVDFLALGASAPHAAAAELLRRAAPPEAVSAQLSDPDPSVRAAAVRLAGWAVTSEDFQRRAALGETEHRDFMCLLEMLLDATMDADDAVCAGALDALAALLRSTAVRGIVADAPCAAVGATLGSLACELSGHPAPPPPWSAMQLPRAQESLMGARAASQHVCSSCASAAGALTQRMQGLGGSWAVAAVRAWQALAFAACHVSGGRPAFSAGALFARAMPGVWSGALQGWPQLLPPALAALGRELRHVAPEVAFESARAVLGLADAYGLAGTSDLSRTVAWGGVGEGLVAAGYVPESGVALVREAAEVLLHLMVTGDIAQQSCPSLLCRHARSILRVDVMHRGKLDPLSLGWFLWVAGREVVDHASRVQAMAHAVAAALDFDLCRADDIQSRVLLGCLRSRDVAALLDLASDPTERIKPPWKVFPGVFPIPTGLAGAQGSEEEGGSGGVAGDGVGGVGGLAVGVFRVEMVVVMLQALISHPSGQQALAAEEAASVEAEGRPEGPLQPTAVDRHVQWLALSMQVLRLTILCLTWDSPESDAAVHLWAALAQMCSSLLRTALASCEGGGGGGAEEGTAPFVPHAAQLGRLERELHQVLADAFQASDRVLPHRLVMLLWLGVHHGRLGEQGHLERVIRGLSDAVPALCRLMTDGVAEAGAEADVQGMMGPSPLRLGGDAGESPKPRWMRAVRMLVESGQSRAPPHRPDECWSLPDPGVRLSRPSMAMLGEALVAMLHWVGMHVMEAMQSGMARADSSSVQDTPELHRVAAAARDLVTIAASATPLRALSPRVSAALDQVVQGMAKEMKRDHPVIAAGLSDTRSRLSPTDAAFTAPGVDLSSPQSADAAQLLQAAVYGVGWALAASAPACVEWGQQAGALSAAQALLTGAAAAVHADGTAVEETDWERERRSLRGLSRSRAVLALLDGTSRVGGVSMRRLLMSTEMDDPNLIDLAGCLFGPGDAALGAESGPASVPVSGVGDPVRVEVSGEVMPDLCRVRLTLRVINRLDVPIANMAVRVGLPGAIAAANLGLGPSAVWALPLLGARDEAATELHLEVRSSCRVRASFYIDWDAEEATPRDTGLTSTHSSGLGASGGRGSGVVAGPATVAESSHPGSATARPTWRYALACGSFAMPLTAMLRPVSGAMPAETFRLLWDALPLRATLRGVSCASSTHFLPLLLATLRHRPLTLASAHASHAGHSMTLTFACQTWAGGTLLLTLTATRLLAARGRAAHGVGAHATPHAPTHATADPGTARGSLDTLGSPRGGVKDRDDLDGPRARLPGIPSGAAAGEMGMGMGDVRPAGLVHAVTVAVRTDDEGLAEEMAGDPGLFLQEMTSGLVVADG